MTAAGPWGLVDDVPALIVGAVTLLGAVAVVVFAVVSSRR